MRGKRGDAKRRRTRSSLSSSGHRRSRASPSVAASCRDRDVDLIPHLSSGGTPSRGRLRKGRGNPSTQTSKRPGGLFWASLTQDMFGLGNKGEPPGKPVTCQITQRGPKNRGKQPPESIGSSTRRSLVQTWTERLAHALTPGRFSLPFPTSLTHAQRGQSFLQLFRGAIVSLDNCLEGFF
jgi:hypothetical protein